jgi:collagen type V/XI/XXIV/XXVII alpha
MKISRDAFPEKVAEAVNEIDDRVLVLEAGGNVGTTDIADLAVTTGKLAADAVTNAKLADDAVSIENIDAGAKPIKIVVGAGIFTTAGGDANESITVTDCVGTDTALVWVQKAGATPRTVDTITPGTGSVAVVLSGDPSTDTKLGWIVIRAAA